MPGDALPASVEAGTSRQRRRGADLSVDSPWFNSVLASVGDRAGVDYQLPLAGQPPAPVVVQVRAKRPVPDFVMVNTLADFEVDVIV